MLILTIKFPKVTNSVFQSSLFVQLLYYHHPKICLFLFRAGNSSCDFPNSCSRVAAVWGIWGKYPIGAHLFILRSPQNAIAFSLLQYKNAFMSWGFTGRMQVRTRLTAVALESEKLCCREADGLFWGQTHHLKRISLLLALAYQYIGSLQMFIF